MSRLQRSAGSVLLAIFVFRVSIFLETRYITDRDLLYPVALLTKLLGSIMILISAVRLIWLLMLHRVRAIPDGQESLGNLCKRLLVTIMSLIGFSFGVYLMVPSSGQIEYWPLVIVAVFGVLAGVGIKYLLREWRAYCYLRKQYSK